MTTVPKNDYQLPPMPFKNDDLKGPEDYVVQSHYIVPNKILVGAVPGYCYYNEHLKIGVDIPQQKIKYLQDTVGINMIFCLCPPKDFRYH